MTILFLPILTPAVVTGCYRQEAPLDLAGQGGNKGEEEANVVRLLLSNHSAHTGGVSGGGTGGAAVAGRRLHCPSNSNSGSGKTIKTIQLPRAGREQEGQVAQLMSGH